MQRLDTQMEEMQHGSEQQCRQLFSTAMPFSEPIRTYHYRRRAYQGILNVLERTARNASNAYRDAMHCGIPSPRLLNAAQCRDGIEACKRRLQLLKGQSVGLRKVHLRDSYIRAQESGDDSKCKDPPNHWTGGTEVNVAANQQGRICPKVREWDCGRRHGNGRDE